jgi:gliding motility-associated-like protein
MNKCIVSLFFIFCFLHLSTTVVAQDFSNKGREFWVVFPPHAPNGTNLANLSLYISSDKNSSGYIIINGDSTRFIVDAFTPKEFILDRSKTYVSGPESANDTDNNTIQKIVQNRGIKVVVDDGKPNVVVYAHMYASARSAATIILPTSVLERRYQVVSYTQTANTLENGEYRKSQFSVIAVEDNTTLRIQLRKNGVISGIIYEVTLPKAGDIYSFQDNMDLTGTSIESISSNGYLCKKIAVFSGSSSLSIGSSTGSVDPLFQQCYPLNSWGLNYFITPFLGKNKFIIRILAKESNTNVVINGQPAITLSANEFKEIAYSNTLPFSINSDKSICVAQYSNTQSVDIGLGDPDMVILNSIEQNLNDVTVFLTSKNSITDQNINIVIRDEGIPSFKINGKVPTGVFKKIANTNYSYLQEKFIVGAGSFLSVRLSSDSGFNAFCYGFGQVESYMYSAGTNVKDLFQKLLITNKFASVTSEAVTCIGAPFIASITLPYKPVSIKWKVPNYTQIDDLSPMPYDSLIVNNKQVYTYRLAQDLIFSSIGTYTIQVIVNNPTADGCTGEQEISFDLEVIGPPIVKNLIKSSNCLADSVTFLDQTVLTTSDRKITNYKWDIGTGVFKDTASIFNYKYNNAGTYIIKYFAINDIGCVSDTITSTLIIDSNPAVNFEISSITCQNTDIIFTDKSIANGNSVLKQWVWDFGDDTTKDSLLTNQQRIHKFDTAKLYSVTLYVKTVNGCVNSLVKTFTNHPIPNPGFIMPKICLEDEFALFIDTTSIADNSGAFKYKWNFGDQLNTNFPNTDTVVNPKHRYLTPGLYNVALEVTSKDACVGKITNEFTVNGSIPISNFKVLNDTALCSNKSVRIENISKVDFGTIGKLVIYWDYDRNILDTTIDDNPSFGKIYYHDYNNYQYPDKTNFNIKLISYSGISCFDDTAIVISIVPPPTVVVITSSKNYACSSDSLHLFVNIQGGAAPFNTTWTSSDLKIGNFTNNILNGIAPGTIDISILVKDLKQCEYLYPNIKNIDIRSIPIASLYVIDTVICNGDPITLKGSGGLTYNWLLDNKSLFNGLLDTLSTTQPGSYQLIVNDGFCNSLKTTATNILKLNIPKYQLDYSAFACLDVALPINTDVLSQPYIHYKWNFGDGIQSTIPIPFNHTYRTKGNFVITLEVNNDYCPKYEYVLKGDTVRVIPPILPKEFTLFVLADQDSLFYPQKIDSGYTSYHWYPAQYLSNPNSISPVFRGDKSIEYTLSRTDPNTSCVINDIYKIIVSNDIVITLPKAFSPNGDNLNDILKIEYSAGLKTFGVFKLFNRYGKIVFQTNRINEGWNGKVNGIDQEVDAYTYFLEYITFKDEHITKTGSVILLR